ncbi:MAG TPA: hypothetical protein VGG07_17020 [Solirubrobacteraceae bacterium]
MIDEGLEHPWPAPVPPAVEPFLQGHLIVQPPLFYVADLKHPIWGTTRLIADAMPEADQGEDFVDLALEDRPPYGIITTQSCDLSEERPKPRQPWLAVAPVYRVSDDSPVRDRDYVFELAPPELDGEIWVADLRIEMPLEKGLLVGRAPIDAFPDEDGYIAFGNFLARRRGRPALASVFHEVVSVTTRRLKEERNAQRTLARRARQNVYKLMCAIEDGTRLEPVAAKLYVLTDGPPTKDARAWFDLWWTQARVVAERHGLQLLPTGWLDASNVDLRLVDDLVEMRSPL